MQFPFGIENQHRDAKDVYKLMMTQPLVFGEHVDLATRDLLSKASICVLFVIERC